MDGSLRVLDIQEKEVSTARPPSFPTPASAATGFPGPKKRTRFASAFKQQRQQAEAQAQTQGLVASSSQPPQSPQPPPPAHSTSSFPRQGADEKATIDLENRARLQDMGAGEIEAARQELLSNIDPSLLQILLRRANLDDASSAPLPGDEQARPQRKTEAHDNAQGAAARETPETKKRVLFASVKDVDENEDEAQNRAENDQRATDYEANNDSALLGDGRTPPVHMAPILSPEAAIAGEPEHRHRHPHDPDHDHDQDHDHTDASASSLHFPRGPSVPDLDPADPDFLEHLHAKYFPNLPADPARLAWMAPLPTADSPADRASPYYPGQDSVSVAQLRFDFRGRLVPPTAARTIPVSKGLHHHGEAPEAAGYTIAELARLARSAVPAQRCVAFQTLGRILYRLGRGEWGAPAAAVALDDPTTDPRVELARGIWRGLSEGRVLETLHEAAGVEDGRGHRGSRAYAIEAIWLYEKGGWKERWKGR